MTYMVQSPRCFELTSAIFRFAKKVAVNCKIVLYEKHLSVQDWSIEVVHDPIPMLVQ